MLLTQVLTDDRFKQMIQQSQSNDEIVGWMRLSTEGEDGNEDFPLTQKGAIIGRSLDCDIRVKEDRAISRQHARLDVRPNGQVTISRLSAVNPVVVGGVQVSNRHPLKPNDVIHLSDRSDWFISPKIPRLPKRQRSFKPKREQCCSRFLFEGEAEASP